MTFERITAVQDGRSIPPGKEGWVRLAEAVCATAVADLLGSTWENNYRQKGRSKSRGWALTNRLNAEEAKEYFTSELFQATMAVSDGARQAFWRNGIDLEENGWWLKYMEGEAKAATKSAKMKTRLHYVFLPMKRRRGKEAVPVVRTNIRTLQGTFFWSITQCAQKTKGLNLMAVYKAVNRELYPKTKAAERLGWEIRKATAEEIAEAMRQREGEGR